MIQILDPIVANGIAAGEVVERPASVVKELVENSLDAGSSIIHCDITQGGIKKIIITDNGIGMSKNDALLSFERHATSKLHQLSDLDNLHTMGFRGEALASIAAVSKMTLKTRQIGSDEGFAIVIEAGKVVKTSRVGCPEGTTIEVANLFYNVPARYKFLKRDSTEQGYISDLLMRLALARADVSFKLTYNGKEIIHTPGNNNLLSAIYVLMGRETAEAMIEVDFEAEEVLVNGYVSSTQLARGNRSRQVLFVNGRNIQSRVITAAINEAGKTWFMKGKFPSLVLNLTIPLHLVDVNVHPQKTEVRFWDDKKIFHAVYHALRQAWEENSHVIKGEINSRKFDAIEPLTLEKQSEGKFLKTQSAIDTTRTQEDSNYPEEHKPLNEGYQQMDFLNENKATENYVFSEKTKVNNEAILYERLDSQNQAKAFINTETSKLNHNNIISQRQENKEDIKNPKLAYLLDARLIGQVFQTYLLLEHQNQFIIIDQHAAHERILYESLHEQYIKDKEKPFRKQILLVPLTLDLNQTEMALVEENLDAISHLGFEVEVFGENHIVIRSVPDTQFGEIDVQSSFEAIVDSLVDQSFFREDKRDELLYTVACKAAVKANDKLSYQEMKKIIEELLSLKNPYHCPHGRPLIISLTRTDLDKLFRRII